MRYISSLGGSGSHRGYTFDATVALIAVDEATGNESVRESFAEIQTVSSSEVYKALSVGLKPSLVIILPSWADDYTGQDLVDYAGCRYRVLRVYRTDEGYAELTVARLRAVSKSDQEGTK